MTLVAVNRLHWPVTVLGPGHRVGVWFQGCTIECPGCVSRDTWPAPGGDDYTSVDDLVARIDSLVADGPDAGVGAGAAPGVDGVTVTGGEPFEQAEALEDLLRALREWLDRRGTASADLLVYTGYDEETARTLGAGVFALADAVIAGPFRVAEPGTRWWGSGNQRLVARNGSIAERYQTALAGAPAEVQVAVEDGQVFIIGIPPRRTLAEVESRLAGSGIRLGGVSWRP